jgi:hypothetical protein
LSLAVHVEVVQSTEVRRWASFRGDCVETKDRRKTQDEHEGRCKEGYLRDALMDRSSRRTWQRKACIVPT